jgi:hypothetical protein
MVASTLSDPEGGLAELRELTCDAWALLCEGVAEVGADAIRRAGLAADEGLAHTIASTSDEWGGLLAFVASAKVLVSRASLLETFCVRAWDAQEARPC